MGQTIDDAIGEAIDKIARNICIDWSYSGGLGKALEKLAETGSCLPLKISSLDHFDNPLTFSFSGLKTALVSFIKHNRSKENLNNLAATVQKVLFDHLLNRTELCVETLASAGYNVKQMSVIGGVASNQYFKHRLNEKLKCSGIELIVPPPDMCTDNAVMIGLAAVSVLNNQNLFSNLNSPNRPDQEWNVEELSISKCMLE